MVPPGRGLAVAHRMASRLGGWAGPLARGLVVSLGAGLLTTIAVAWGLSASESEVWQHDATYRDRRPHRGEGMGRLIVEWRVRPGAAKYEARVYPTYVSTYAPDPRSPEEVVPAWAAGEVIPWTTGSRPWPQSQGCDDQAPTNESTEVEAAGWPALALWRDSRPGAPSNDDAGAAVARGAASVLALLLAPGRVLPHRPIWFGLGANTAAFGGAWWILMLMPGLAVRAVRTLHGRCAGCGYDLRGLPSLDDSHVRCPECGAARGVPGARRRAPALAPAI